MNGFSLKRRMVKLEPFLVTCFPRVACSREPSGMEASSIGCATEMCFPHFWASQMTKPSNDSSLLNFRFEGTDPYFR